MSREYKRMSQRRGNKSDLPTIAEDGELSITMDTVEIFYGANGNQIKILDVNSFVNTLENPSATVPVSVAQLANLNKELQEFKLYIEEDVIESIESKQDTLIVKGLVPPQDKSLMWFDTN